MPGESSAALDIVKQYGKTIGVVLAAILAGGIGAGLIDQEDIEAICPPCECAKEAPATPEKPEKPEKPEAPPSEAQ